MLLVSVVNGALTGGGREGGRKGGRGGTHSMTLRGEVIVFLNSMHDDNSDDLNLQRKN